MAVKSYKPGEFELSSSYMKSFIYGPPGTGKTVLAASAQAPLLAEIDPGGADSLWNHPELLEKAQIEVCDGPDDIDEVVKRVRAGKYPDRKTFCLDTSTTYQDLDLREMNRSNRRGHPSEYEFTKANTRLRDILLDILTIPNMNIIILAHEREEKKNDGRDLFIRPDLQPRSYARSVRWIHMVGYLHHHQVGTTMGRRLLLRPARGMVDHYSKTRYRLQPQYLNPTWSQIEADFEKWRDSGYQQNST